MRNKVNANNWQTAAAIGAIGGVVLILFGVVTQGHVQVGSRIAMLGFLLTSLLWWKVRPWRMRSLAIFLSAIVVAVFQGHSSITVPDELRFLGDDQDISVDAAHTNEPYRVIRPAEDGLSMDIVSVGNAAWTTNADGWVTSKMELLQASIPHGNFVRRVQFTSSNIVDGRIVTKRFGVIKVREYRGKRGEYGDRYQEVQMTEPQFQTMKRALYDAKRKWDATQSSVSR